MRSGKSLDLLARLNYYEKVYKKKVCLLRKKGMHRDGIDEPGYASSRDGIFRRECIDIDAASEFNDLNYDVYAFEEAQFIDGVADLARKLFFDYEKIVIVSCLNGNYRQEPFGGDTSSDCQLGHLMAMFSHVTFATSSCTVCGAEASYSGLVSSDVNMEGEKKVGDEEYGSYCSECVFKYRRELLCGPEVIR